MEPRNSPIPQIAPPPAAASAGERIRSWLANPRGLLIGGIVIIVAGLGLGWNWVVALGLAPIILAVAPCAVMCALGMCMMGMGRGKSAVPPNSAGAAEQKAITELPPSRDSKV